MTLAFPIIGSILAWKVGNGDPLRIGVHVIIGCGRAIYIPNELFHHLQMIGKVTLNQIVNPL